MVLCKKYNNCEHKERCPYSKPFSYKKLRANSLCYEFVQEKYYYNYLRKQKLEKIEKNIK